MVNITLKDTTMMKRYLTDEEQRRLLGAARQVDSPLAKRDWAWMRLLIETGMRVAEASGLTQWQCQDALASGWLVVDKGQRKGKKRGHEYLVTAPVRECLEVLTALHRELRPAVGHADLNPAPLLWGRCRLVVGRGQDGQAMTLLCEHISVRSLQARMAKWAAVAGLPDGVSPHWLRHTRGVNIIQRSRGKNPLKVAQEALGHASIASTGIYVQMSREAYVAELHNVAGGRMRKGDARAAGVRMAGA